jgi:hypothetical protein
MFNPAISTSILAATRGHRRQESFEQILRKAGAVDPASAIAIEPASRLQRRLFDQAVHRGVIVPVADGRYHLNERALAELRQGMRFAALLFVIIAASLIASIVALAKASGT